MGKKRDAAYRTKYVSDICPKRKATRSTRYMPLSCWLKGAVLIEKEDEKSEREKRSLQQPSRAAGTTDLGDWRLGA